MQRIIFNIKTIREQKKITLYRLSKITGISHQYLSNLEKNKVSNPTASVLLAISDALNVNVKDLFYTSFEVESLKKKLYQKIDKYGINSPEALEISQLIDLLNLIDIKKNKE